MSLLARCRDTLIARHTLITTTVMGIIMVTTITAMDIATEHLTLL
jgi:hypothetical protein